MTDGIDNIQKNNTVPRPDGFENIIGSSQETAIVLRRASISAKNLDPVLITGERGTGRKLLAETIARTNTKTDKHCETVKCIASNYVGFDQELLGSEQSVGILKKATGGTLILDEIDKCSVMTQLLLMKAFAAHSGHCKFSTGEYLGFKIIATSTCNLLEMVKRNEFLPELFYVLATITIETIPLRSRTQDIPLLAKHFLEEINTQNETRNPDYTFKTLSADANKTLRQHTWPGNVSELRMVLRQSVIFSNDNIITKNDLPIITNTYSSVQCQKKLIAPGFDMNKEVCDIQRGYISQALKQTGGKKSETAKLLGLKSYQALDTKMKSLKMSN